MYQPAEDVKNTSKKALSRHQNDKAIAATSFLHPGPALQYNILIKERNLMISSLLHITQYE